MLNDTLVCYGFTQNEDKYMIVLDWHLSKCKWCYGERSNEWAHFCQSCQTKSFQSNFANWTSGNADIDEIIRSCQLKAKKPEDVMEWIPFSQFSGMEKIVQGGFCSLYEATWKNSGCFLNFDINKTTLKCIDALSDLLNEVCVIFFSGTYC